MRQIIFFVYVVFFVNNFLPTVLGVSQPKKVTNATVCSDAICPVQCAIGYANGCQTCTCPPGIKPIPRKQPCPDTLCPGHCSVGFANGCKMCTCPEVYPESGKKCPDVDCPGSCSVGLVNGCKICNCSERTDKTVVHRVQTPATLSKKCPDVVCPGHCFVGVENGCKTCSCPPGIIAVVGHANGPVKNCTEIVCPNNCLMGFRDGCRTCTCPIGFNVTKQCPEIVCPGRCSVSFVNGCRTCNCPVEPTRFLQSAPPSCDSNNPCPGDNEDCTEFGVCLCVSGYTKAGTICVQMPTLGENCIVNGEPVYCDGYGVNEDCNLVKGSYYGRCVCKLGFVLVPTEHVCRPIENVLGQSCTHDRECVIAYSYCSTQMKCACIPGFLRDQSGLCSPPNFACPFNGGFNVNVASVECEVYYDSETSQEFHTCKANEFCYQHPKSRTSQGRYVGHCCPSPPSGVPLSLVCPLTISYNGTCPDTSNLPMDSPAPPDKIATCPFTTHDCIRHPFRKDQICCPLPCRASSSHFAINGLCYDYVLLGEPCKHTAQCTAGSDCNQAKCQCKTGFKQVSLTQCIPM